MSLFLHLFNGKTTFNGDDDDFVDDWGEDGPILGPYESVQLTYGFHWKLGRPDGEEESLFFHVPGLDDEDPHHLADTIPYGGLFYGDVAVLTELAADDKPVYLTNEDGDPYEVFRQVDAMYEAHTR